MRGKYGTTNLSAFTTARRGAGVVCVERDVGAHGGCRRPRGVRLPGVWVKVRVLRVVPVREVVAVGRHRFRKFSDLGVAHDVPGGGCARGGAFPAPR